MTNITLLRTFRELLIPVGLLLTLVTIGVAIIASVRSDSWGKRRRYLLLGASFSFLSGISMGAYILIDNPDLRAVPTLLFPSFVWGLIGAIAVFNSMWAPEWWRRFFDRCISDEKEKNEYV